MTFDRRWARSALATLLAAGALAACSTSGSDATPKTTTTVARTTTTAEPDRSTTSTTEAAATTTTVPGAKELDWKDCDGGFECATLEVPVDYKDPEGDTIALALARRPATDPSERIGSLLMNPGGPGGSAVDFIEGSPLPSELTKRFDIVGFDPRGVGRSDPLDCRSHLQEIYQVDPTMEDQADKDAYLKASKAFVDECAKKYKDLLPFLGTVNVARDMDEVRKALGEEKITYVGYSYGTSIGQQYAKAFPTHVRAMVLDGVVDSSVSGLQAAAGQAKGFTRALDNFVAACDANDCGLKEPAAQVIDEVIADAEQAPIPAKRAGRPATPGVVALALGQALYSETLWPQLARALQQAATGNGNGLVGLADQYLQRQPDGSYPNGFEIYFAVSCLDSPWPKDPNEVFTYAKLVAAQYPRVGEALVNDYVRCALWPGKPQPVTPLTAAVKGLPPPWWSSAPPATPPRPTSPA
ncbi:alpha/beta hydrolase [Aquihabitans sp. G128]|uniref:alpha/beta fold hydrolase n=1 Tax=Aquihabitans sp. G128 TaxID=2849779 RepID=UPI001C21B00E|nr:alpha/beta fold hydrolase [Aquihabitans sp. G128]QXC59801.1 alpha/beta hydrolase [Aquihabitans sp. G128]